MATRKTNGQWEKGQSGNPSGRPKRTEAEKEMIEAFCSLAPLAVKTIRGIMESDTATASLRLKCAEIILERVCGRAMTPFDLRLYEAPPQKERTMKELIEELTM